MSPPPIITHHMIMEENNCITSRFKVRASSELERPHYWYSFSFPSSLFHLQTIIIYNVLENKELTDKIYVRCDKRSRRDENASEKVLRWRSHIIYNYSAGWRLILRVSEKIFIIHLSLRVKNSIVENYSRRIACALCIASYRVRFSWTRWKE